MRGLLAFLIYHPEYYANEVKAYQWEVDNAVAGGDSSSVVLRNVKMIYTNDYAFAALKYNGSVVTWGIQNPVVIALLLVKI